MSALHWRETARQFFKFGIVGGVGFVIDSAFLYLGIYALGLDRVPAGLFSFPFAVTATWIGNRLFTFRHAQHIPALQQLAKFAAVCAVGLVFNRGTYSLLVSLCSLGLRTSGVRIAGRNGCGHVFQFLCRTTACV